MLVPSLNYFALVFTEILLILCFYTILSQLTAEGTSHQQRGSKRTNHSCGKPTNPSKASCFIRTPVTSRPHRLRKTSSMLSKRRDSYHIPHRETNDNSLLLLLLLLLYFTTMNNHNLFYEINL